MKQHLGKRVDYLYYFERQLKEALDQLFSVVLYDTELIYRELVITKKNLDNSQFAILFNTSKLDNSKKRGDIKSSREEMRSGATALLSNEEIRNKIIIIYIFFYNRCII